MNYNQEMFGIRFSTLSRQWRRYLDHQLSLVGIKDITWSPVVHLAVFGDGISQKELARSVGIEGPALVRLLDTLEQRQYIVRKTDDADRRSKLIYLTAEGVEFSAQVRQHLHAIESSFLSRFSDEQFEVFHQMMNILQQQLDQEQK